MVVDGFCFPEISFDSGVPQSELFALFHFLFLEMIHHSK